MTAARPPRVGVVIVTYNAAPHIARCLAALHAQTLLPHRSVLIDNASRDSTAAVAEDAARRLGMSIEIVKHQDNLGFAAANNRGVERLADCDLIALLNPDAFPQPAWLAALVDAAERHPEAGSFASRLILADDTTLLDGAGDVFHVSGLAWRFGHRRRAEDFQPAHTERPVFSACAAAALYRRVDWVRVGGFDERYFCYAEDVDLGFRLQLIDRPAWYVPSAVALHVGGAASRDDSAFAVYHGHRNLEWTFVKNMPTRAFARHFAIHVVASMATIAWFVTRGATGAVLRAKFDALKGLRVMMAERRRIQAQRTASDDAIERLLDHTPLRQRFRDRAATSPR